MNNYVLAQSWARANVQDRLWYCMAEEDKDTLKEEENMNFGDKVYILASKKVYIMGNDNTWYEM